MNKTIVSASELQDGDILLSEDQRGPFFEVVMSVHGRDVDAGGTPMVSISLDSGCGPKQVKLRASGKFTRVGRYTP